MNIGDAILSGLNGYKADAMSRAEAIMLITEAIQRRCNQCGTRLGLSMAMKTIERAVDETNEKGLVLEDPAWEDKV